MSNYLDFWPIIALSDYQQSMFQLVTIKQINDSYHLVNKQGLRDEGPNIERLGPNIERYNLENFFKSEFWFLKQCQQRQSKLLLAIERKLYAKIYEIKENNSSKDRISSFFCKWKIDVWSYWEYFYSLVDKNNVFFIDKYLETNTEFRDDVVDICINELDCNAYYLEDLYLTAAYLMFGPLVVDRTDELRTLIIHTFWDISKGEQLNSKNKVVNNFYNQLRMEVKRDEAILGKEKYLQHLLNRKDQMEYSGEAGLAIFPKVHIIHVIDNNENVIRRYLEIPQVINDEFFKRIITNINKKTDINDSITSLELERGIFEDIFPKAETELTKCLSSRLFFQIPLNYVEPIYLRKLFSEILLFLENRFGKRVHKRYRKYSEEQMIYLILSYGLEELPKKTVRSILKDTDRKLDDVSIQHLRRNARNDGIIWGN